MKDASREFENGKHCFQCQVKFTFRKYRYHCRRCYKSFCYDHCQVYQPVPELDNKKVRVCMKCDLVLDPPRLSTPIFEISTPKIDLEPEEPNHEDLDDSENQDDDIWVTPANYRHSIQSDDLSNDTDSVISSESQYLDDVNDAYNDLTEEYGPDESQTEDYESYCPATPSDCLLRTEELPPGELLPLHLKIVTYNVWMMPDRVTKFARSVSPNKEERAVRIALELPKSDVVVFQEAFCNRSRTQLLDAMAQQGYLYRSPVVGRVESGIRPLDGGVVLVSRHPIIEAKTKKFSSCCTGDDRFADKGILYCCIAKDGQKVHVFATHTQAWNYRKAMKTRALQFRMVHRFIQEMNIPTYEPVLVAGDLNVDKWAMEEHPEIDDNVEEIGKEHGHMLDILRCREAEYISIDKNKFSFDSQHNLLAAAGLSSDGSNELLDYILYSYDHRRPTTTATWVCPLKSTTAWATRRRGKDVMVKDLSDHYPVVAEYSY